MLPLPQTDVAGQPPLVVVHEFTGNDTVRDHELETLWFSLCIPVFQPVTLVPVPGVGGADVVELASRLAEIGAMISGEPVTVVDAVALRPVDAIAASALLQRLTEFHHPTLIVVESPTVDPVSMPIVHAAERIVLVVQLDRSRTDQVAALSRMMADEIFGVVCIDPNRRPSGAR